MPQLDYSYFLPQVFWLAICFGLLYIVSKIYLIPLVSTTLLKRKLHIDDTIQKTEIICEEVEQLKKDYKAKMDDVNQQSRTIKNQMLDELSQEMQKMQTKANQELEKIKLKSCQDIIKLEEKFEKEIDSISANIASTIIKKILQQKVKSKDLFIPLSRPRRRNEGVPCQSFVSEVSDDRAKFKLSSARVLA